MIRLCGFLGVPDSRSSLGAHSRRFLALGGWPGYNRLIGGVSLVFLAFVIAPVKLFCGACLLDLLSTYCERRRFVELPWVSVVSSCGNRELRGVVILFSGITLLALVDFFSSCC